MPTNTAYLTVLDGTDSVDTSLHLKVIKMMCALTTNHAYLNPLYANNLQWQQMNIILKETHIPHWLWESTLTYQGFGSTCRQSSRTNSLCPWRGLAVNAQEAGAAAEHREGAGLPLLPAARCPIGLVTMSAQPQDLCYGKRMFGKRVQKCALFLASSVLTFMEFNFWTDVTVAQQTDGTTTGCLLRPRVSNHFALQIMNSLKTQCLLHREAAVLRTAMFSVLF